MCESVFSFSLLEALESFILWWFYVNLFVNDSVHGFVIYANEPLQIVDPILASYGVENPIFAVIQLAQTTMRSELGKITLDKTFEERDALNENIVVSLIFCCHAISNSRLAELNRLTSFSVFRKVNEKCMISLFHSY